MNELNKKLLKFAGFTSKIYQRCECHPENKGILNYTPDGDYIFELPDFPNDLNACFKWFEKPLVDHFIEVTDTEDAYRVAYFKFMADWLEDYIWNEPHKPALSFCKAVEILMEKK